MANKLKPLTPAEQLALREKARRELERLDSIYADENIREKVLAFKEKFGICEIRFYIVRKRTIFPVTFSCFEKRMTITIIFVT